MNRRREITFETEKIVIRGELPEINWCDTCAALAPKLTAEQAAILLGEEIENLFCWAECGQLHSTRTQGGVLMICLKSLWVTLGVDGKHNSLIADKETV